MRPWQAHTADGEPYLAPVDGGFGTWVWAFERGRQSEQAREYMTQDVVTPFLEIRRPMRTVRERPWNPPSPNIPPR